MGVYLGFSFMALFELFEIFGRTGCGSSRTKTEVEAEETASNASGGDNHNNNNNSDSKSISSEVDILRQTAQKTMRRKDKVLRK